MNRKLRYIVPLLLIICSSFCKAQDYDVSLKKLGSSRETSIQVVHQKLEEAEKLFDENPVKSLEIIEEVILLTIKENNRRGEAKAYTLLGTINANQKEYRLSYFNFKKAYTIYISLKEDKAAYDLLPHLAESAEMQKSYDDALKYNSIYLNGAKKKNNKEDEVEANLSIARIYKKKGNLEKSEEQFQEVYQQGVFLNSTRSQLNSVSNLGEIKVAQNKPEEALKYYEQSLELANDLDDEEEVNNAYENVSQVYEENNNLEKALEIKKEAAQYNYVRDNNEEWIDNNIGVANIYINQNKPKKAIKELEKTVEAVEKTGDLERKKKAIEVLSKAYEKQGQSEKALKSFKEYLKLEDSIAQLRASEQKLREGQKELLADVQSKMLVMEKDKQLDAKAIELLQNERSLKEEQLWRQQLISYGLAVIVFILAIASYLIVKNVRQKRIANQLLLLKSLRNQMNPHFIFNALNSVNNYISKSDERSANKYLSDFSKLMRQVMENSQKDFILLDTEIEILTLYLKLEHSRFKDKFNYTFTIDPQIDRYKIEIPPMLIQPYIENAVWHGLRYKETMGKLDVSFKKIEDGLEISVIDDGIGREESERIKTKNQRENKSSTLR